MKKWLAHGHTAKGLRNRCGPTFRISVLCAPHDATGLQAIKHSFSLESNPRHLYQAPSARQESLPQQLCGIRMGTRAVCCLQNFSYSCISFGSHLNTPLILPAGRRQRIKANVSYLAIWQVINRLPQMKAHKVLNCEVWAILDESPQPEVRGSPKCGIAEWNSCICITYNNSAYTDVFPVREVYFYKCS